MDPSPRQLLAVTHARRLHSGKGTVTHGKRLRSGNGYLPHIRRLRSGNGSVTHGKRLRSGNGTVTHGKRLRTGNELLQSFQIGKRLQIKRLRSGMASACAASAQRHGKLLEIAFFLTHGKRLRSGMGTELLQSFQISFLDSADCF